MLANWEWSQTYNYLKVRNFTVNATAKDDIFTSSFTNLSLLSLWMIHT